MVDVREMDDDRPQRPDIRRRRHEFDRGSYEDRDRRSRRHDGRRRQRRRRYSTDSGTDYDDDEAPSFDRWKTIAVFVVIGLCFAILTPKMFYPMIMYVLYGKQEEHTAEPKYPHPGMRARQPPVGGPPPGRGPMPGGGAGGPSMAAHTAQGEGKSLAKSWQSLMPLYSIGAIAFVLYTLAKIFWRKPKSRRRRRHSDDSELDSDDGTDDGSPIGRTGRLKKRELRGLQGRLLHTEDAMQKILEQLEALQGAVDDQTAQQIRKSTMESLQTMASTEKKAKKLRERTHEFVDDQSEDEGSGDEQSNRQELKGTARYLGDLEKALSDFRTLTETYVQTKTGEAINKTIAGVSQDIKDEEKVLSNVDIQTPCTSAAPQHVSSPDDLNWEDDNSEGMPELDDASEVEEPQQVQTAVQPTLPPPAADAKYEAESDDEAAKPECSQPDVDKDKGRQERGFDVLEEPEEDLNEIPDAVGEIIAVKEEEKVEPQQMQPVAAVQHTTGSEADEEQVGGRNKTRNRKRKQKRQRRE